MVGLVIYALKGIMLDELAGDEMLIAVTQDGCDAKTGPTNTNCADEGDNMFLMA